MKRKANGHEKGVEIIRPLPHRPDLVIVRLADGRQRVFGDYAPISQQEFIVLRGGLAESTTKKLEYTEEERAEIDAAEARLQRAATFFNEAWDENRQLNGEIDSLLYGDDPFSGRQLTAQDRNEIRRLEDQVSEVRTRLAEAHELHQQALVERNRIEWRVSASATARQRPIQLHNVARSTDERISDLEGPKVKP